MSTIFTVLTTIIFTSLIALPPTQNRLDLMNDEIQSDNSFDYLPATITGKHEDNLSTENEAHIRTQLKPALVEVLSAGIYTRKKQHITDVTNAINALNYHLKQMGSQPVTEEDERAQRTEKQLEQVLKEAAQEVSISTDTIKETTYTAPETKSIPAQATAHDMPEPIQIN